MSKEDYIASGILELYAAGGLTQTEREEVEQQALVSPEIKAALDEACAAMEAYARLHAVRPRQGLKNLILSQLEVPSVPSVSYPLAEATSNNVPVVEETKEQAEPLPLYPEATEEQASPYKWMFAASISLFLISGMMSFHFYNKWQQAEERLAIAAVEEQRLARNFETVASKAQWQQEALAVLQDPDIKHVRLQGVEAHPEASILVYWNPIQKQVYVMNSNLPSPPAGKQYQLWALDNGKPIDAGMIPLNQEKNSLQKMKLINKAQAFAVTLETEGGSINPTLEQLMVMGEITS